MEQWELIYQEPEDEMFSGLHAHFDNVNQAVRVEYFTEEGGSTDSITVHFDQLESIYLAAKKARF